MTYRFLAPIMHQRTNQARIAHTYKCTPKEAIQWFTMKRRQIGHDDSQSMIRSEVGRLLCPVPAFCALEMGIHSAAELILHAEHIPYPVAYKLMYIHIMILPTERSTISIYIEQVWRNKCSQPLWYHFLSWNIYASRLLLSYLFLLRTTCFK